jgi:hypothetical protein
MTTTANTNYQNHSGWLRPAAWMVAVLSTTLILYWGFSRAPHNAFDDAYITYRYADNFRQGLGLLYNQGEWVLGTTTPLYVLLLGVMGLIFSDLELLSHWVGVICWLMAAVLTIPLFRQENRPYAALIAPLFIATLPTFYSSLGMETPLLVALMLALAVSWLRGMNKTAVLLAALLILTRHDSALWLLVIGLEVARRRRQNGQTWVEALPWREGVVTFLLTLPWFIFALFRYGSPFPNSAAAKIGQNNLMPVEGQPSFAPALLEAWFESMPPLSLVILLSLLLISVYLIARHLRRFWWLLVWPALYTLIYTLINIANFPWYFVPPLAVLSLALALALGTFLGDTSWAERPSTSILLSPTVRYGAVLLCLVITLFTQASLTLSRQAWAGYRPSYLLAAQWLRDNTDSDATVATIEIGVIGYHSHRPILDTQGLISQDLTSHQLGWDDTLVYALNAHEPDYALALPGTAWDIVTAQWWFRQSYRPVEQFAEATLYGRKTPEDSPVTTTISMAYPPYFILDNLNLASNQLDLGRPLTATLSISVTQTSPPPIRFTTYLVNQGTFDRFAITDFAPFENLYPSQHWQKGDYLQIPFRLTIPETLPWGAYNLGIIMHNTETGFAIGNMSRQTELDTGLLTYGLPQDNTLTDADILVVNQSWSNGMRLNQIGLPNNAVSPGDDLPIQFSWDTTAKPGRDWTYFIHIIDDQGEIVTQLDQRPWNGRWPTTVWQPNQPFLETATIFLPADMTPGTYDIRLGFYIFDERLLLAGNTAEFLLINDLITIQP